MGLPEDKNMLLFYLKISNTWSSSFLKSGVTPKVNTDYLNLTETFKNINTAHFKNIILSLQWEMSYHCDY